MKYYKAYETNERPFTLFDLVAESLEDLQAFGLEGDPLVVTEDQLFDDQDPDYISFEFGICHKRIFNGEIEDRPSGEITAQEANLNKSVAVTQTRKIGDSLDVRNFTYAGREFPLTAAARDVYKAVFDSPPADATLITTTGSYVLPSGDIAAFKTAYNTKILSVNSEFILP